jgi:hypothetical protein
MDLLEGYEVKSVQLFSLLAYVGGDDRLGPRRMGNLFVEKFQQIGARLYRVVEMYFSRSPDISVFPAIFDDVEPYFERSDAAYSDMEFTLSMALHNINLLEKCFLMRCGTVVHRMRRHLHIANLGFWGCDNSLYYCILEASWMATVRTGNA